MLVLPTRQCASRPVPPLTSPFIILYVAKRCGGRKHVNIVNSCGRSSFLWVHNESQRVATSRNGSQRASSCWLLPAKSQPQRVATGRNGRQRVGFYMWSPSRGESQRGFTEVKVLGFYLRPACLPAKSEPRRVATGFNGSPSVGFRWRLRNRGESQLGQTRFDKT